MSEQAASKGRGRRSPQASAVFDPNTTWLRFVQPPADSGAGPSAVPVDNDPPLDTG